MSSQRQRNILICSGFDPLSGAGVIADHAVMSDFGCMAYAVPTSLVVQDTHGVRTSHPTSPAAFHEALSVLLEDVAVDAVKVGVIGCAEIAESICELLGDFEGPIVVDPVLSGGTRERPDLGNNAARHYRSLRSITELFTPNEEEARRLLVDTQTVSPSVISELSGDGVAQMLATRWETSVLQSGGHSVERGTDLLVTVEGTAHRFRAARVLADSDADVHGTGCHLSSAITALLASGQRLEAAVPRAKRYVAYLLATHRVRPGSGRQQLYHDQDSAGFARGLLDTESS